MSGYSEATGCPRCRSTESLERSIDKDDVNGICLECGHEYHTAYRVMTLEEVNQERAEFNMEPLTELKKPVKDWKD